MMNWIVSTSLRLRVVVLALSIVLMIVGIQRARNAPLDVFPEFAPPLIEIQTEAPGLSTEEVESLISVPLENSLNGTIGLKTIRSKSVLGLSSVVLILKEGTDLMASRQVVQERLSVEAPRLPAVGEGAALGRGAGAAGGGEAAGDPVSPVVDEPAAQDRRVVEDAVADGAD